MYYEWTPNPLGGWHSMEMEIEVIKMKTWTRNPGRLVHTGRILETISDREYTRRRLAGEL